MRRERKPPPHASCERLCFFTDAPDFHARSHGDVGAIDATRHRLRESGRVASPLEVGRGELHARRPERTLAATLECAGNRRADLDAAGPVAGDLSRVWHRVPVTVR